MPDLVVGMTAFLFIVFFLLALKTESPEWFIIYTILSASAFTFLFIFTVVP